MTIKIYQKGCCTWILVNESVYMHYYPLLEFTKTCETASVFTEWTKQGTGKWVTLKESGLSSCAMVKLVLKHRTGGKQ